jgi:uncharacterized protein (TIGR03067 family)
MDTEQLLGTWQPLRAELDGELAPVEVLKAMKLIFDQQHYWVTFGGEVSDEGDYAVTSPNEPFGLALRGTKGVNQGRLIPAIAQLRGDRLRICYGLKGTLPDDFSTAAESNRYLITYRRAESNEALRAS